LPAVTGWAGRLEQSQRYTFLAGYNRGSYLAHSRAIAIDRSWSSGVREETADDWALITLAEPIGKTVGYLKLERFNTKSWQQDLRDGKRYAQAGYSHDRSHVLTRHINCEIQGFLKGEQAFAHRCDATNGDSGSPILARRGKTYSIVGLHVASARDRGFGIAITGARIAYQLPKLTQNLPRAPAQ
jgi:protease YdgD